MGKIKLFVVTVVIALASELLQAASYVYGYASSDASGENAWKSFSTFVSNNMTNTNVEYVALVVTNRKWSKESITIEDNLKTDRWKTDCINHKIMVYKIWQWQSTAFTGNDRNDCIYYYQKPHKESNIKSSWFNNHQIEIWYSSFDFFDGNENIMVNAIDFLGETFVDNDEKSATKKTISVNTTTSSFQLEDIELVLPDGNATEGDMLLIQLNRKKQIATTLVIHLLVSGFWKHDFKWSQNETGIKSFDLSTDITYQYDNHREIVIELKSLNIGAQ